MKYTVVWVGTAEKALTELWLQAANRQTIAAAAHLIDRMLELVPDDVGESRDFDQRLVFASPIAVLYFVNHDDMLVRVLRVWQPSSHNL